MTEDERDAKVMCICGAPRPCPHVDTEPAELVEAILLRDAIEALCVKLSADYDREVKVLKSLAGPTGLRSGLPLQLGLTRNNVRSEVISALRQILEDSNA